MISTIQIQTIDACNLNCVMCPRKWIFQTKEQLTLLHVKKIANDIANAQKQKMVKSKCRIIMNFLNEPLLDPQLMDKIKAIKEICNCHIDFYTNGTLAHQYKEWIINHKKYIGGIIYSNYGDNLKKWRKVAGVKYSQENFDNMKKAIDEIEKHITVRRWDAWRDGKLFDFSTRAGTVKKVKIKSTVTSCEWVRPFNYINIHSNGDVVLCCQDWKRETKYGNILKQPLDVILRSDHYSDINNKALGKPSDANFICKRCKWSK